MKIFIVLLLFAMVSENAVAIRADSTRTELLLLLKERKKLFDKYSLSLDKKSGFFSNRTKNDLKDSQEKLVAIVVVDNKIMNSLNRTLDFRNFEKLNLSYDVNSFEDRIRNLTSLNDTLSIQNIKYKNEIKLFQSTIKKNRFYIVFLLFLLLIISIAFFRKFFNK